jgi:hypothetical protein
MAGHIHAIPGIYIPSSSPHIESYMVHAKTRTDILATNTNRLLESNAQKKHLAYDCMEFVQLLGSAGNKLTSEQI